MHTLYHSCWYNPLVYTKPTTRTRAISDYFICTGEGLYIHLNFTSHKYQPTYNKHTLYVVDASSERTNCAKTRRCWKIWFGILRISSGTHHLGRWFRAKRKSSRSRETFTTRSRTGSDSVKSHTLKFNYEINVQPGLCALMNVYLMTFLIFTFYNFWSKYLRK